MTILYSNGCSFTANMKLDRTHRYLWLVGQHFGWEVHDKAISGSCNSKIIRCTLQDCVELLDRKEKILALVQLTFKERWEYSGDPNGSKKWQYTWSRDPFEVIKPGDESNWPPEIKNYAKQIFLSQNPQALYTQLFSNLLGLVSFFKNNGINYKIFAGPRAINDDQAHFTDNLIYKYLGQDCNIIDLTKFNMLDLTGKQDHPDINGMTKIADYFINQLGVPG